MKMKLSKRKEGAKDFTTQGMKGHVKLGF